MHRRRSERVAPSARELHEETVRKLAALSKYDCLRANKSTAAWGLETRVPFLDKEFLDYAMSFDPEAKMCPGGAIEKGVLMFSPVGFGGATVKISPPLVITEAAIDDSVSALEEAFARAIAVCDVDRYGPRR